MSESPSVEDRARADSSPPPDLAHAPSLTSAQKQAEKQARKAERAELRRRKEERRRLREIGVTENTSGIDGSENEKEEGGMDEKEESRNTPLVSLVPESPPTITQNPAPTSPIPELQTPLPPFSPAGNGHSSRQPLTSYAPPTKTPKAKGALGRIALTPPSVQMGNVPKKRKTDDADSVGLVKKPKAMFQPIAAVKATPLIRPKKKDGAPLVSDSEASSSEGESTDERPRADIIPETILPESSVQAAKNPSLNPHTTPAQLKPKPTNAKAGPSKSTSTPKSKSAPSNPFARPPKKTRSTGNTQSNTNKAESDEQLRQSFKTPGAMNAYLASGWINLQELKRLEEAGIIIYKKGKFSEDEKGKLREALGLFKHINRLSDDELVDVIMAKGRFAERKEFPKFWPEIAANVPGRPVKYVKDHVRREYDPRGNKGSWTRDEDVALLRAYQTHPNEWAKIAIIVDRTEQNVRDRWRKELRDRPTRETGHWTRKEEVELVKHVKEMNKALGQDPLGLEAPWDLISEKMSGKRTLTQCRVKWRDQLRPAELQGDTRPNRFGRHEKMKLIARLRTCKVTNVDEIPWEKITWDEHRRKTLREAFQRMKGDVPEYEQLSFSELLDKVESRLTAKQPKEAKKMQSGKPRDSILRIVSAEVVEDNESESESESDNLEGTDGDDSGSSSEAELPQSE